MLRTTKWAALALAAAMIASSPASAAPVKAPGKAAEVQPLYVPFDPPTGKPIRYRWEKHQSKNGVPSIAWHSSDFVFEKKDDGYRLVVTPVDWGSNASDPRVVAAEKKLAQLTSRPVRLVVDAEGAIAAMEGADVYWSAIIKAIGEALGSGEGAKALTQEERERFSGFMKVMTDIPPEVRLGMLTEAVQPASEFGGTELTPGEPLHAESEIESPFGGPIKRDVTIQLKGVQEGVATYSVHMTVPPGEFAKAVGGFVDRVASLQKKEDLETMRAQMGRMKFRHETSAVYRVQTATGLTVSFEATETVEVKGAEGEDRRLTTTSLRMID